MIQLPLSRCSECPYFELKEDQFVPPSIDEGAKVLFVGEGPGANEVILKQPFVGKSGRHLRKALKEVSINTFSVTNTVLCRPPENETPKVSAVNSCRPNLEKVLLHCDPTLVVPVGASALKAIEPGVGGITARRGHAREVTYTLRRWLKKRAYINLNVFPTFHPQYTLYNPSVYPQWIMDLGRISKVLAGKPIADAPKPDYTVIDNPELLDWADSMLFNSYAKDRRISFDIETSQLNYFKGRIVGISFAWRRGQGIYIPILKWSRKKQVFQDFWSDNSTVMEIIIDFLKSSTEKSAHNLMFDQGYLRENSIEVINACSDTMIGRHLLHEDLPIGLKTVTADEYPEMAGYDTELKNSIAEEKEDPDCFGKVPAKILGVYSCADADGTYRLDEDQEKELKKQDLWGLFTNLEMPLQDVARRMKRTGVLVDLPWQATTAKNLNDEIEELEEDIYEIAGKELNLNSTKQVAEILFKPIWEVEVIKDGIVVGHIPLAKATKEQAKKKVARGFERQQPVKFGKTGPSTDKEVLLTLSLRGDGIAKKLLTHREHRKMKTAFVDTLPDLIEKDGRVHPDIKVCGTISGRWAMSGPALNTTPRRKDIRGCYRAPEGSRLITFDMSQLELRIQAELSEDEAMLKHFKNQVDLHTEMACRIFGAVPGEVTDLQRQIGKGTNFSAGYGGGPQAVARAINKYFGPEDERMLEEQCTPFIKAFFSMYPGMKDWAKQVHTELKRTGQVRTRLGRIRRLPAIYSDSFMDREEAKRQAVNFLVQSLGVDIVHFSLIKIDKWLRENNMHTVPVMEMHDALYFESPEEEVEIVYPKIKEFMETPPIPLSVELVADGKIFTRWDNKDDDPVGGDLRFSKFRLTPYDQSKVETV
tara:strand:+ start:8644 stop:11262 length:2619 start_codon:yes stop_codon:yes gene_type:complete